MTSSQLALVEEIRRTASELPLALAEGLADAIEGLQSPAAAGTTTAIQTAVPQPHYRAAAFRLLDAWQRERAVTGGELAFALVTAARCADFARRDLGLELVWTGPEVEAVPPRRTEQALLQVIDSAKVTLTVVSFVAYKVPVVATAIAAAARRGVSVRLVLEDAEVSQGRVAFDALNAFGPEVAARAQVYVWPADKRATDPGGRHGSLHAKCAVADTSWLLISSANLTEHAFNLNIELGVLIKGGDLPSRAESYWTSLIQSHVLKAVTI